MSPALKQEIKQTKPFASAETEVYLTLVRLCEELSEPVCRLLKTAGLSLPQYNVLRILRGAGKEGLACREIAERMVHRVPDVTRLLDRLDKRGLVTRKRATNDRRIVRVRILPTGRELIDPLDKPLTRVHKNTLGGLGARRLTELLRLLEDARDNLP